MSSSQTRTAAAPNPAHAESFPWPAILVLSLGALWTVTAELLPAGLLLKIGPDVGVAPGTAGYLVTAWGATIAVACLPLARLTRAMDRRTVLAASLGATGAATLLTALAPGYGLLVAARTLAAAAHGLFWSQVVVAGSMLAGQKHATRAVAVIVAGPTLAGVASIPAATAAGEAMGWRAAFGAVGALTAVTALAVAAVLPRIAPARAPARRPRRDPSAGRVVTVAALGAVMLVAHFMTYTYIAPVLVQAGNLAQSSISLVLLVFGAAGVAGVAIAPALSRALPAGSLPAAGAALAAALLALHFARGETAVLAAMAGWGVVLGVLPVVLQARLLALASPAFLPIAGAVMIVALNLGIAAGAAAGSPIDRQFGPHPLSVIASVVAGLAALLIALITSAWNQPRPKARPAMPQPEPQQAGIDAA